ncbi:MAG TPA: hypothetical protein VEH58_04810 [Dehalococcoidales bacterium]|nr:hypothetical protein [Dehalococcoidales bacterium]
MPVIKKEVITMSKHKIVFVALTVILVSTILAGDAPRLSNTTT